MTQLVKQRPLAVWCLFLAGAITGGLASSLMEPQYVLAEPTELNGQKFEQLEQLVAAHDLLLEGITRDESGRFVFRDPLRTIELHVECAPDSDRPALSVCGPALFESAVAPSRVLLNDQGTQYPEPDFSGPALQVVGASLFTGDTGPGRPLVAIDPLTIQPGEPVLQVVGASLFTGDAGPGRALVEIDPLTIRAGLSVRGPAGAACIHHDRIELLVDCGDPEAEVFGTFGVGDAGSFLNVRNIAVVGTDRAVCVHPDRIELLVDCADPEADVFATLGADEFGSFLDIRSILAESVTASSFQTKDPAPF